MSRASDVLPIVCVLFAVQSCGAAADGPGPSKARLAPTDANTEPPEGFADGHRLVAQRWVAPGTPALVLAIMDRDRRQACRFLNAADGRLRCLPAREGFFPTGFCLDVACTRPTFERSSCSTDDVITLPLARASCGEAQRYEVRRLVSAPAGAQHFEPRGGPIGPAGAVLTPGEPLAPGAFVEGHEAISATGGRLSARWIVSEDGGAFTVGLFDSRWGRPCEAEAIPGSSAGGCWPAHARVSSELFADEACKIPLAVRSGDDCPALIADWNHFFAVGAPWSGKVYQFRGHGPCEKATTPPAPGTLYALSTPLDAEAVAPLPIAAVGSGRLRLRAFHDGRGRPLVTPVGAARPVQPSYFDTQRGDTCDPVRTRAGELRCLGATCVSSSPIFFADADCKRPVIACEPGATQAVILHYAGCRMPTAESVRPIVGPVAGSVVYYRGGDRARCEPLSGPPAGAVVALGDPLGPPDEAAFWAGFVPIEER